MKILLSVNRYPTPQQPFTAFVSVLAEELVRQGHDVSAVALQPIFDILKGDHKFLPFYSEYCVDGALDKCIKVYRPKALVCERWSISRKFSYWFAHKAILRACKNIRPDVCYGHFWSLSYKILSYAKSYNIPLFTATGEDEITLQNFISKSALNELSEYCRGVICVSSKNKEESIKLGFTDKTKCIVLPNSVDSRTFYPRERNKERKKLGIADDDFVVAYIGRFNHRKGVLRVSDAIKRLKDRNIKSIFIGGQIEGKRLEPDCDGIIYKGKLAHNLIPEYLSAADIFVLPTLAEGCSNSIVEALACGLPIISSNMSFNHDILNERNSLLVDPLNVEEIAHAIKTLKEDKNLYRYLKVGASVTANGLTIEKRVKAIVEFICSRL